MADLAAVFQHLVLPPKVPGTAEAHPYDISRDILLRLIRASVEVQRHAALHSSSLIAFVLQSLIQSLRCCLDLNSGGRLDRVLLKQHFARLASDLTFAETLILYVSAQNAALLLRRQTSADGDFVTFESFEASAVSEEVLKHGHRMQWDFPGRSARISLGSFAEPAFNESLCAFVEQASTESLWTLQASTRKAKVSLTETRDTTDPALITQMLMSLLEAVGEGFKPPMIRKHVRDDVNIHDGNLPWRRAPLWLVLRVAAQRHLCLALGNDTGRFVYKLVIATLLKELLGEASGKLSPHMAVTLRGKLCRRMAKVELDLKHIQENKTACEALLAALGPAIKQTVASASSQIELAWANFKKNTTRKVSKLPLRASDESLRLSLTNSGPYLERLLLWPLPVNSKPLSTALPNPLDKAIQDSQAFTSRIFRLVRVETSNRITEGCHSIDTCMLLIQQIGHIFASVGSTYDKDPEQMSGMVLAIFTLWMYVDEGMCEAYPLLADHRPVFRPELLDTLQLPTWADMVRLRSVQEYLARRIKRARFEDIFSPLDNNSFAVRYVGQSDSMQQLAADIQSASDEARDRKEEEWVDMCAKYDSHTEDMATLACRCTRYPDGTRDVKGCERCWHWRCRNDIRITVHEAYLPEHDPARSAIVFELAVPEGFGAYRDATWKMLSVLAHPSQQGDGLSADGHSSSSAQPATNPRPADGTAIDSQASVRRTGKRVPLLLRPIPRSDIPQNALKIKLSDCQPLAPWMESHCRMTLASKVKCFMQTHYKFRSGKPPLEQIILPLAARFELYDTAAELWVRDLDNVLTLQHICGIQVPEGLRQFVLPDVEQLPPDIKGPSSYEIQANYTECPADLSAHEFAAFQKLLSGKKRRWPNILVEISSGNLNFCSEDTMRVLSQLAVQAGPHLPSQKASGDIHVIFDETGFVDRLAQAIDDKMASILTNWREHHAMEWLITLALRLFELSGPATGGKDRARSLLSTARKTTLDWAVRLNCELRDAEEADAAERLSTYGLHAALLCRRTFTIFRTGTIDKEGLCTWVQASVVLQQTRCVDIEGLPRPLFSMLVRDAKMACVIEPILAASIKEQQQAVGEAIEKGWSSPASSDKGAFSTSNTAWEFLSHPHNHWIMAISGSSDAQRDGSGLAVGGTVIHFNFVEGHLLVNGKLRGQLPLDIRNSEAVRFLFGKKHILTYPSMLPEMSHKLAYCIHDQEIHFGMRARPGADPKQPQDVVIRAVTMYKQALEVSELIPSELFTMKPGNWFDLPSELTEKCAHWLNTTTGRLEVRRFQGTEAGSQYWLRRPRDWVIDIHSRHATRGIETPVRLVDPRSTIFRSIYATLEHFENPARLTVYQGKTQLCVELRHWELSFFVNKQNWLHCRQLNAWVDPDQDAGTLYGLKSKVVLRDAQRQRFVIVPLEKPHFQRLPSSMHTEVDIKNGFAYGKYKIDTVLGRLTCPPEPRLLLTKALLHGVTSFCLPDPLTGRTGTEEAMDILRSCAAQPWTPLASMVVPILELFMEALVPQREYYPPEIQRLQKVHWRDDLTASIQHDGYAELVYGIAKLHNELNKFSTVSAQRDTQIEPPNHLRLRGDAQRRLYQRGMGDETYLKTKTYEPRDRRSSTKAKHVFDICRLVLGGCSTVGMKKSLRSILETWNFIGGFQVTDHPESSLISDIEDPIGERFGSLVNFCRSATPDNLAVVLFRLALLAFATKPDMDTIRCLAAFASVGELKGLDPPDDAAGYSDFNTRGPPPEDLLEKLMKPARRRTPKDSKVQDSLFATECGKLAVELKRRFPAPIEDVESMSLPYPKTMDLPRAIEEISVEWERRRQCHLLETWADRVQEVLKKLNRSREASKLFRWPADIERPTFLGPQHARIIPSASLDLVTRAGPSYLDISHLTDEGLLFHRANGTNGVNGVKDLTEPRDKALPPEIGDLRHILERFPRSGDNMRERYVHDLLESLDAFKEGLEATKSAHTAPDFVPLDVLEHAINETMKTAVWIHETICSVFRVGDSRALWLRLGNLWPCVSPTSVLRLLGSSRASGANNTFGTGMKEALVKYGLAITRLQRLMRIRNALIRQPTLDSRALAEELLNPGHENWSPLEFADWLLIEIESDLLIRAEQVDVAKAIIAPESRTNSVLQMNMGKGKTSLITPMVVAVLADATRLVRLIVPKALLLQTAQTAQSRLGGLVGRKVIHIPFSRKTPTDPETLDLYSHLHKDILTSKGLILTTHEHTLSFKLGGWQHLADGKLSPGKTMVEFQRWLDDHSRDVLDECDVSLSVKTQLNYPGGPETMVDGQPWRWQVPQELLSLVALHVRGLQGKFSRGIEVQQFDTGSFPVIHILQSEVEASLHKRIVDDICAGQFTLLRYAKPSTVKNRRLKLLVAKAVTYPKFDSRGFQTAVELFENPQAACKILIIIRGLLVNKILLLCLAKRWNVQYGLHPDRHPVAVPFEAKGVPSEQAEFGHPDVAILFTCLAFYYSGLSQTQFCQGLRSVLQSDDPAAQYEWWLSDSENVPETLRQWNLINVEDGGQVEALWQHAKMHRTVINHYLNHFVFPLHARQFEKKLQASAWDIPLVSPGKSDVARSTGFSGTNDGRFMLPLTIHSGDLPSLRQTSAEVISYLLQERNRQYQTTIGTFVATHGDFKATLVHSDKRLSEDGLLFMLCQKNIRILIDAGAYILEMDNKALASAWLKHDHQARAAVYFDQTNRAMVHYRGDQKLDVPLVATPFADSLDDCLVYLDEAHTRGVDLKLPPFARGALTLALKQTKDYTVQAAMRLRALKTTQSVTFFAPPEVDQSIRDFCKLSPSEMPDSSHVVSWLLEQTCRTNEDLQGLYKAQGLDFCNRTDAIWRNMTDMGGDLIKNPRRRDNVLSVLRQPERRTLDELYGKGSTKTPILDDESPSSLSHPQLQAFAEQLRSRNSNGAHLLSALQEVEQEREVEAQVEQVRLMQKARRADALKYPGLHPDIEHFARHGVLRAQEENAAYLHAFELLGKIALGKRFGVTPTGSRLFVSREFERTIDDSPEMTEYRNRERIQKGGFEMDNYVRPVEFVLWSPATQTALVINPEEAEETISILRNVRGADIKAYLLTYSAPVTRAMSKPFNSLRYYTLPELPADPSGQFFPNWLLVELGILAGRLYLEADAPDWKLLEQYLRPAEPPTAAGLSNGLQQVDGIDEAQPSTSMKGFEPQANGQKKKNGDEAHTGTVVGFFAEDPAGFLMEWLALRRRAQDVQHTPVGGICMGRGKKVGGGAS